MSTEGVTAMITAREAHDLLTAQGQPFEMQLIEVDGIATRSWVHAPPTIRDAFDKGRTHGNATFLVYEDERASFEAFAKASLAFAHRLIDAGVRKGDRVAIAMRNLPEWPVAFYGTILAGGVATPLNAWWTGSELAFAVEQAGARVAIIDQERFDRLDQFLVDLPSLSQIIIARAEKQLCDKRLERMEATIGSVANWPSIPTLPYPEITLEPDDNATLFFTSGTTGRARGALGTHRNMMSNIMANAVTVARAELRRGSAEPPCDTHNGQLSFLVSVPLFHASGCHGSLSIGLFSGAKLVLTRKWDVEEAFALIERERITTAGGVPTIIWDMVNYDRREEFDLSSLTSITFGGAAAAFELAGRVAECFPQTSVTTGWGMTELSGSCTLQTADEYRERPASCGLPIPVCDVEVRDSDGAVLSVGAVGELWARGPNVVRGYWNEPVATATTFVDGWVRSGDLGYIDSHGFVYIVDRCKDVIIRGGENIYCPEVEGILQQHPDVLDAALVPVAHETLGEVPGAVIQVHPEHEPSEASIAAFVAERTAAFKVPAQLVLVTDKLPRNAGGKFLKDELKPLFQTRA